MIANINEKNINILHPAAILVLLLLIANLCSAETGVFNRNIVLATHQPLSGPAREYSGIGASSQAYFQYVNDQGGVHGRSIELIIIDDQLKPYRAKKMFMELTARNDIFAVFSGIGSKTHQAVYPLLKQQRLPSFFVGSDLPEWTQPVRANVFGFMPTADTEARVLGKYFTQKHSGERLIVWYSEKPLYLRAVKALASELDGIRVKLLPGKPGRLSAEWNLIRKREPDLLVALGNFGDLMDFLKASPQLNIPIYTGHALADSLLPVWLNVKVSQRVRFLTAYPLIIETEHPGQKLHKLILNEYAPHLTPNRWTLYGHAVAELMVEVLKRSGRTLSRQKAISAAENIKQWQGKLLPPVHLDSRNHQALTSFRVSRIESGMVNHESEWIDGR